MQHRSSAKQPLALFAASLRLAGERFFYVFTFLLVFLL